MHLALLLAPDVSLAMSMVVAITTCKLFTLDHFVMKSNQIRVYELLSGNGSDVHKLTAHVQMLLDFER